MCRRNTIIRELDILQKHLQYSGRELQYWYDKYKRLSVSIMTNATDTIIEMYLQTVSQIFWISDEIELIKSGIYLKDSELRGIK